ncbi:unnamed protein product [Paramecium pentaurelia]|uniref:Uncharacterized protein n=1 Tax=Paramecium pentaurelia TaxID=43138 RepID=A0A8S1TEH2_9CILI|nr:unnamed protein product [Paramecium pentaurelia]
MKKQKQIQTLFKYFQSDEYEMEQEKKPIEIISYIKMNEEFPIFELILENCPTFVLDAQTSLQLEKLQQLIYLGINGCQIKSLIHLPLIDSLKRLTLDNNYLKGEQLKCIGYYKDKLISLSLINNQLKIYPGSLSIQHLQQMSALKQLSLIGNIFELDEDENQTTPKEEAEYVEMRNHIFNLMPNLIYLDCIERSKLIQDEKFFNNYNEENEYLSLYVSKSVTQYETSRSQSMISVKKNNGFAKIKEENSIQQQHDEKQQSTRQLRQQKRKMYVYD